MVLFPEIGWVIKHLSLSRPHSLMCIRIYIFNFKKQTTKKNKNTKKEKENKEEKRIPPENRLKK